MIEQLHSHTLPESCHILRAEVSQFLSDELSDYPLNLRARSWQGFNADFSKKLAGKGWVGLTLPKKYGGAELDYFARFTLVEALLCSGAPVAAHWISDRQSGPLILKFGTAAQKNFYLPKICQGDAFFCIGMSEPNSGSDLASVRTKAEKVGNQWKINGQKVWTTYAHHSHYMIALIRTSGKTEDRHQGLSQIIIDLTLDGVEIRPIQDLAGESHFAEVFFHDVLVNEDALIGTEGDGWRQVNAELAFERSGPERLYSSIALLEAWIDWLKSSNNQQHEHLLGKCLSELIVIRGMSVSVSYLLEQGKSPLIESALVKDIATTYEQSLPALIEDAISTYAEQSPPYLLLQTLTYLSQIAPMYSLRGGTREILRTVIAKGLKTDG